MSAYKIKHKKTGKFLSTTASSRYLPLYFSDEIKMYPLEKALVKNGRVYSTKKGAEKTLKYLNSFKVSEDQFEIYELN